MRVVGLRVVLGIGDNGSQPHALQLNRLALRGVVAKVSREAAVVGLQKLLQNQAGEQPVTRELLQAAAVGVSRQRLLGDLPIRTQHCHRRLAGRHALLTRASHPRTRWQRPFSTEPHLTFS